MHNKTTHQLTLSVHPSQTRPGQVLVTQTHGPQLDRAAVVVIDVRGVQQIGYVHLQIGDGQGGDVQSVRETEDTLVFLQR